MCAATVSAKLVSAVWPPYGSSKKPQQSHSNSTSKSRKNDCGGICILGSSHSHSSFSGIVIVRFQALKFRLVDLSDGHLCMLLPSLLSLVRLFTIFKMMAKTLNHIP